VEQSEPALGVVEGRRSTPRRVWLGLVVVYVVVLVLFEPKLLRPGVVFDGRHNTQIVEAESWWNGRLDLPARRWDTALWEDRAYSHFPVMFTLIAAVFVPLCAGVPQWAMVLLVLVPVPLLAYALFLRRTSSPFWAALLAIGLVCGTSAWPVMKKTVTGGIPYQVNHTLALIGLLILLVEYYGRRRIVVLGLGLLIATMSRQLTMAFLAPLILLALDARLVRRARSRIAAIAIICVIVVGVPLVINTLKFGHPLQTGYKLIYEGREEDGFARDAKIHGLFAAHFLPRNLYYMNLGLPRLQRTKEAGKPEPNTVGSGIWWTTPLLIWVLVDCRRLWRDRESRVMLASCAFIFTALMFFHATGSDQRGYNRFSLDFLPVMLAVGAPSCLRGRRRWVSLLMVVWSVAYFRWMI